MNIRKFTSSIVLCTAMLAAGSAHAERALAISRTINPVFYSACALGGEGEFIDGSGEIHVVLKDDGFPDAPGQPGGVSLGDSGFLVRGWNLTGIGRTSGHEYRLIDSVIEVAQAPGDGSTANWFFSIRANFIDPGPDGSHTQLIQTFRIVQVNGDPVVDLFNTALECRGPGH
ncbi:MAG: hypothetical protein OEW35_02490 [Gammaproteobacteria bacterium]|nr:hypothetical protein [Gammaproteobacteria bacterium]MDH4255879.1 hypothetical protein [Gammaproteobacteria bacterium]MDH5309472.1 hypothetical protein [Gammaproteobacteria bacterium]